MALSQRLILGGVNARANNPALLITPKVKEEWRKGERTSELGEGEGEGAGRRALEGPQICQAWGRPGQKSHCLSVPGGAVRSISPHLSPSPL